MTVEGVVRFPLRRFEDERGWFCELRRDSALPRPTVQTNLSFSRKGVIRGLHYHERGQDDLFVCMQGMARVVVLNRGRKVADKTIASSSPEEVTGLITGAIEQVL